MNTATTPARSDPLPEFYYLANFRTALAWLSQRYADLLSIEEQAFIDHFALLAQPSQALLVRMIMRRGSHFRLSKLSYAEIGDCLQAAQPLLAHNWLSTEALLTAEELAELLRKDEMLSHLTLPDQRKSQSKAALSEQLVALAQQPQSFRQWCPALDDQLLSLQISELCDRLRLMFFGNLGQDWSEFVLADLGIYRYEAVDISPQSRGFQSRQDIEDYLLLRDLRQQAEQGAELTAIVAPLLAFSSNNPYLAQRQSRLLFQLGQQLEKAGELEQALALYQRSQHGQARWRQVRVLELLGRDNQALEQAEAFAQKPGSDEESQRLARALTRLRRRLGLSQSKPAKAFAEVRMDLVLDQPEHGSVEWAVLEHLHSESAPVFYLENTLLCSLFGLLCWEAIFAPLPGAFFHPFHSAPVDLYSDDFVPRRQQLFSDCLARLDQPDYPYLMLARYQEKYATQSPFVFWQMLDEPLLKLALACIPAAHLRVCFSRLLRDLKANRAGMPDLIQFYPERNSYRMIEVKGPGDRLQDNQKRWLNFAAEQGIAVEVCYVSWRA
ncbi:VRR-NUC domain-containing protein [Pseudomonas sp. 5P_3.1_Bac2]|uniref:VRR-NUC domain-containing protein n=1 Tax=Pseudomonas sp. 5P_3.1_Bac2 TaxID=2971617 RepID=UPI0021C7891A|nr:VRR-NUC domain-containing protein [Pseudomonas sp. 5P_3.1_Bac2]MCU1717382.1 VRR-NUC domain-containing protein [Pseudomonas sp. 5P_3.1_Bac2]